MKSLKFLTITMLLSLFVISCSEDDNGNVNEDPQGDTAQLYATNNTNGNVTQYDFTDESNVQTKTFLTLSADAEGIYYDGDTDELTQASRTMLQLNTYSDISLTENGLNLNLAFGSSADLVSPRDLAVNRNFYVVSDNSDVDGNPATADGRLFVYVRNSSGFTLRNVITVDFKVWGIEFVNDDLYLVVDATNDIAVFTDFAITNTTSTTAVPNKRITVEGIVRTHGLAFDGGTMILTDIGDASVDTDGAFHIISNFQSKFDAVADGGTLLVAGNQTRVAGSFTLLGNPVSADYDAVTNTVFIAERANGGGRILAFTNADAGGNIGPDINNTLSGASSVYFYRE